uniref:Protein yippee-like 2 isoform X4 n=1 Tax=Phascolarctos cinereus TaxID=38626 RepID=A0A6P5KUP1_PHACI|nr:protein yippee-like 2 isoform X4 [Phascolarctos cinereus]
MQGPVRLPWDRAHQPPPSQAASGKVCPNCMKSWPTRGWEDLVPILTLDYGLLTTCRRPLPASESFLRSHCQRVEPAPHPPPAKTTAFTCVFRCFPCDPSCGSTSWATPEFGQHSAAAPMVKMTRSKTFQAYLPSCHRTYSCIHCRAHLANHDELISKEGG